MEDIIARLEQTPLFAALSWENKAKLAAIVIRSRHEQGETIVRQGDLGTDLFIVHSGEAVARAIDEKGEQTPPRFLRAGDFWGETSLLIGEPRDATIRVKGPAELLRIRKADFDQLVKQNPEIWQQLRIRPDVKIKLVAPRFPWLAEGERIEWFGRKHWIVFARNIAVLGLFLLGLTILLLVAPSLAAWNILIMAAIFAVVVLPWLIWSYIDWQNDFYVITDRRIVHIEEILLQYRSRSEAPLDKVQNISTDQGLLGNWLGYAHVYVVTAGAQTGRVDFRWATQPDLVEKTIVEQIRRFRARQRRDELAKIGQLLEERLRPTGGERWWEYAPETPREKRDSMSLLSVDKGCLRVVTGSALYSFLRKPHLPRLGRIVEGQSVIWRKHWIILVMRTAIPAFCSALFFALTAYALWDPLPGILGTLAPLIGLFLFVLSFFWLNWRYEDWRNDLYIVTPTHIIDIERQPFLFSESRRQAGLENIQNIRYDVPGFWSSLFNCGDVIIETAGQGEFTFISVRNPSAVQREIFGRIEALRERMREAERRERETELGEWFAIYHRKAGGGENGEPPG